MMRRSVRFLFKKSRAHVTSVADTAIIALIVGTSKRTSRSKALTAKLQVRSINSTENATIVVNMATRKKSVASN